MLSVSSAHTCCTTNGHSRQRCNPKQMLLLRSCPQPSAASLWRRNTSFRSACTGSPVPFIPCDDQAGVVYTAINQAEADDTQSSTSDHAKSVQPASNGSPPPEKQPRIPHRWRIVLMMALAFVLCNMDKVCLLHMLFVRLRILVFPTPKAVGCARFCCLVTMLLGPHGHCGLCMLQVNMSVAVIPMAEELGWSATDRGLVSSAFFWGYALTQIPAGYLSTK